MVDQPFCLAKAQVANEYCIEILKDKWVLLKEICIQFNQIKDMKCIVDWIFACCIFHNILPHLDNMRLTILTKIGQEPLENSTIMLKEAILFKEMI